MLDIILQSSEHADYDHPPPSYTEAITDLPPEYSALPPRAETKDLSQDGAALAKSAQVARRKGTEIIQKPIPDVSIDFENPSGVRERARGKKKKQAAKKAAQNNNGGESDDEGEKKGGEDGQDAGDAGKGGDGAEGGNNNGGGDGGGGGDDEWAGWGDVGGNKKKKKKKKQQEEEERRKKEEEEERQRKEVEERKAKEEEGKRQAEEVSGEADPDDAWAGFTPVGKKKKSKNEKVRHSWIKRTGLH